LAGRPPYECTAVRWRTHPRRPPPAAASPPPPARPARAQLQLRKKEDEAALVAPYSASFQRTMVETVLGSESGGAALVGRTLRVGGWVKTGREAGAGAFAFLEVNDGSCYANLQVMVDRGVAEAAGATLKELVPTSTCVLIEGTLAATPEGTKQKVGAS
jgi:asparaginyl-tRNA synthetase